MRKFVKSLVLCFLACMFVFCIGACEKREKSKDNSIVGIEFQGKSMSPTIESGDKLQAKLFKSGNAIKSGDIIVLYVGDYEECAAVGSGYLVKRLIAVEGEWVKCVDGVVQISKDEGKTWQALDEPYAYYGENDENKENYDFDIYKVGDDEIFFLGDNRSHSGSSIDSRYKENLSHLDRLYTIKDVYAVVIEYEK